MTTPLKLLSPGNRTLCSSDLPLKPTKVFCDNRNFSSKNFDPSKFSLVSSSSSFTGWSGVNMHRQNSRSANLWFCGYSREDQDKDSGEDDSGEDVEENLLRREVEETLLRILASCEDSWLDEEENLLSVFESDEDRAMEVPTRFQMLIEGTDSYHAPEIKPITDVDYLQELLAIQKQGPRAIGFFGTRNMGFLYQELIEILSYAMVITGNHIFTSGASGTNAAVIRGALRADKPELLTVILPQSLKMQPLESQELLSKVKYVVEKPCNDHLPLIESSRKCNRDIVSHVQQVICFAFRDSKLLLETCQEAKKLRKILTLFYLD